MVLGVSPRGLTSCAQPRSGKASPSLLNRRQRLPTHRPRQLHSPLRATDGRRTWESTAREAATERQGNRLREQVTAEKTVAKGTEQAGGLWQRMTDTAIQPGEGNSDGKAAVGKREQTSRRGAGAGCNATAVHVPTGGPTAARSDGTRERRLNNVTATCESPALASSIEGEDELLSLAERQLRCPNPLRSSTQKSTLIR